MIPAATTTGDWPHRQRQNLPTLDLSPNNSEYGEGTPDLAPRGSLELLALAVSLFFVATVAVEGDRLFASAPASTSQTRVTIDPDSVLKEDFERSMSSVQF